MLLSDINFRDSIKPDDFLDLENAAPRLDQSMNK